VTQDRGPGDLVDDRFRLIERLGSGAMGAVWRALDEVLQREVALKEVRPADPSVLADPDYAEMLRARVLREARALARIQHPHVVTIHHVIDRADDRHPWLVMELVRGGTLEDRLASGPLTPAEAAELGRGLLSALRAAHAAGICHRDVKPANVLLRPDGSPVLTDFGIADLADTSRLTMTGGLTGSPAYIAPERLHGSEGDPASDLWSLGMLLYVAVEGRHPLRRTTAAATLAAVMAGVVPPAPRAGTLEPALRAVLVADPARRATADQLAAMLARALDPWPTATAVPAPPVPGTPAADGTTSPADGVSTAIRPRPRRRSRPGPVISAVAGLVALALIGGAIVGGNALITWVKGRSSLSAAGPPTPDAAASATPPATTGQAGAPAETGPTTPTADPTRSAPDPATSKQPTSKQPTSKQSGPKQSGPPAGKLHSLHTAKGMRQAVAALQAKTGTSKFSRFVAYPDYAVADVPVKGRKTAIDRWMYDDGEVELWSNSSDPAAGRTVDLAELDWDFLPALFKRADRALNVDEPESRYLVVDAAGTFTDGEPVIRVYITDKYSGGYLTADLRGRVIDTHPAQ